MQKPISRFDSATLYDTVGQPEQWHRFLDLTFVLAMKTSAIRRDLLGPLMLPIYLLREDNYTAASEMKILLQQALDRGAT